MQITEKDWARMKGQLPACYPDTSQCFGNMDKAGCNTTLGCKLVASCCQRTIQRQIEPKPKRVKSSQFKEKDE